jgi:hypothetical protein
VKIRYLLPFLIVIVLGSCTKTLKLDCFTMDVPLGWSYEPGNGTDSFMGNITTSSGSISFNYSREGFASSLTQTEEQFVADQKNWAQSACYFCKPGVTYVPKDSVEAKRTQLISKPGNYPAVFKVEANIEYTKNIHKPDNQWKRYYPGADYIAELKYSDSTIYVPIQIPGDIKDQNIKIDTTDKYIIKTVWPKVTENGTTGVYIKSRTSALNFNMQGSGLSEDEQNKALKAFKTIKLKQ